MVNKEEVKTNIEAILNSEQDSFQDKDIFLVDVKVTNNNRITVHIDSFGGTKVADCATLSKFIEEKLDRESEDFELIVSSAGLDKPFKVLNQYKKNIGRTVEVQTVDGEKVHGELLKVLDTEFVIKPGNKKGAKKKKNNTELNPEQVFKYEYIKQVKLVITF